MFAQSLLFLLQSHFNCCFSFDAIFFQILCALRVSPISIRTRPIDIAMKRPGATALEEVRRPQQPAMPPPAHLLRSLQQPSKLPPPAHLVRRPQQPSTTPPVHLLRTPQQPSKRPASPLPARPKPSMAPELRIASFKAAAHLSQEFCDSDEDYSSSETNKESSDSDEDSSSSETNN